MSRPKWPVYLILFWFRVWYTTDPVFCKLHLPCIKKCDQTLYQGQLKVKVNLCQSSCYFDLRSNFQLDLPRSKSIRFDASWREKHDNAWIIPLSFLVWKIFAKTCKSSNCHLFFIWPDLEGSRYDLKRSTRVSLGSQQPNHSFGLCPAVLSQLWAKWHGGCNPPPMCVLGWENSMCGRGLSSLCISAMHFQQCLKKTNCFMSWIQCQDSVQNK